jgi:PST family polysaccharide transporter
LRPSKSATSQKLLENFFSLSVLQGIIYLINFVTFPYLVRVLGPEKFGLVAFVQVFIQYFIIATDYGFNLTATREISIHREQNEKVSEIFSAVLFIKLSFMLISGLVLLLVILTIPKFREEWLVYTLAFGMVIGNVLFPVWFFQGLERMKYITVINVVAKSIFAFSIFVFIKQPSHYPYVLLLHSLGFIIAGTLSIWIARTHFGIKLKQPSWPVINHHLKTGWYMFMSNLSINFYKTTDLFILGLLASEKILGYYAIVKKLIEVSNQFAVIISQTIYPHISKKIRESYTDTINLIRKVSILTAGVTFLLGLLFFFLAELIVRLLAGQVYPESVLTLKMLAIIPFIVGWSVPPTQILLGGGFDKKFSLIVGWALILSVVFNLVLIHWFLYIGAALNLLLVELFVTGFLFLQVYRNSADIKSLSHPQLG